MSETEGRLKPGAKDYAMVYGLLVVVLALCFFAFTIWRQAVFALLTAINPRGFAIGPNRVIYQFVTIVVLIVLFVVVLATEPYLRGGITGRRRQLRARFVRLALPLVGFCVLGLVLRYVAQTLV
ncbi:MAG: hypothetical protein M3Q29_24615 [Chloroflexota bacterium]|nr:hypothetical protein [Chloroflexota bacterium]